MVRLRPENLRGAIGPRSLPTDSVGAEGRTHPIGQVQLLGATFPNQTRQEVGGTAIGCEPDLSVGAGELCRVGGNGQVAAGRKTQSSTGRQAVDRRDNRRPQPGEPGDS